MKRSFSLKTKILLSIVVIFVITVSILIGAFIYLNNKYISEEIESLSGATITVEKVNEIRVKSYKAISLIFILGILLILILGNFLSNKFINLIDNLKDKMYLAGSGDLRVRMNIRSNDEIGDLYSYFNVMMAQQTEIIQNLKNHVHTLSHISQEVAIASEEVGISLEEISQNIDGVAREAQEGINSVVEVSQVLLELSSLIQMSKELALSTRGNSQTTLEAAEEGKNTIEQTMESMVKIEEKSKSMESLIDGFTGYLQEIIEISNTINGLADQTNLLALNASIEAARAGESGRGFTVVAEEIRKLAEQSNKEATEVTSLVEKIEMIADELVESSGESLEEVRKGKLVGKQGVVALDRITQAVNSTAQDIEEIVSVTEDEVASSDKIVQLIDYIATSIENTAASIEEVASSTEEITSAMEDVSSSTENTKDVALSIENITESMKTVDKSKLTNIEVLEEAKTNHLSWKLVVSNMLRGTEKLTVEEVASHRECKFGKWYESAREEYSNYKAYEDIEHPHKELHSSAIKAVEAYNRGDVKAAKKHFKELDYYSGVVIKKLNRLIADLS